MMIHDFGITSEIKFMTTAIFVKSKSNQVCFLERRDCIDTWLSCNALNNTLTDYLMNDATQLWNDTSSFMMRFRHTLHETERVRIAGRWYPKYELSPKRQRTVN